MPNRIRKERRSRAVKLRRILVQLFIVTAVLLLPVLVLAEPSQSVGGGADVVISVIDNRKRMRYEADVIFRNTTYTYNLVSVAENVETGERYINSGFWREASGVEADSFTVSVQNRANHALTVETEPNTADFDKCGAGVTLYGDGEATIPEVEKADGKTIAYESVTEAVFGRFPRLDSYKGVKRITATVRLKHP